MSRLRVPPAFLAGLALASAGALPAAQGADPFAPGVRWTHAPQADDPWIPRDVAFVAEGALVLAAPAVGKPGLTLHAAAGPQDGPAPLHALDLEPTTLGPVLVGAGDAPDELFALHQVPAPTAAERATLVTRHDGFAAAAGAGLGALWTHDLGTRSNAAARLAVARDGSEVLAAAPLALGGPLRVDRLDPATGALRGRWTLSGTTVRALALSGDGRRLALAGGSKLWVLELGGAVLLELDLAVNTNALALSGDGRRVAFGTALGVDVRAQDDAGVFVPLGVLAARGSEVAVEAAFDDAGGRLAASFWDAGGSDDVRLTVRDVDAGRELHAFTQTGAAGDQNFPAALALTPDGTRVALGLWGTSDARPDALVFEVGTPAPLLALDLGGSVEALDLDPRGRSLCVASKDGHANRFTRTGRVGLAHTGEEDVLLSKAARPGGTFEPAYRPAAPGAGLLLGGTPLRDPWRAPFFEGALGLRPDRPLHLFGALPDARGDLRASLPIPADPALLGVPLGLQGLQLRDGVVRLSRTRLVTFLL